MYSDLVEQVECDDAQIADARFAADLCRYSAADRQLRQGYRSELTRPLLSPKRAPSCPPYQGSVRLAAKGTTVFPLVPPCSNHRPVRKCHCSRDSEAQRRFRGDFFGRRSGDNSAAHNRRLMRLCNALRISVANLSRPAKACQSCSCAYL
jgi:hypothetical protein